MFAVTVFAMKWHGFATIVAAVVADADADYAYARCECRIFGNIENLDCCDYVTDIASAGLYLLVAICIALCRADSSSVLRIRCTPLTTSTLSSSQNLIAEKETAY